MKRVPIDSCTYLNGESLSRQEPENGTKGYGTVRIYAKRSSHCIVSRSCTLLSSSWLNSKLFWHFLNQYRTTRFKNGFQLSNLGTSRLNASASHLHKKIVDWIPCCRKFKRCLKPSRHIIQPTGRRRKRNAHRTEAEEAEEQLCRRDALSNKERERVGSTAIWVGCVHRV